MINIFVSITAYYHFIIKSRLNDLFSSTIFIFFKFCPTIIERLNLVPHFSKICNGCPSVKLMETVFKQCEHDVVVVVVVSAKN